MEDIHFKEYARKLIKDIIPEDLPVYFWWNYRECNESEYIAFQAEQLDVEEKRGGGWFKFMDGAVKVYDYSTMNQKYYPSEFLPIYPEESKENTGTDIDVLFYGHMTPRREKFINKFDATVVVTNTMKELKGYVNRSRKVLSVGCYNNKYADTFRVVPCLNMGGNLLMERTEEKWLEEYLIENMNDRIEFI